MRSAEQRARRAEKERERRAAESPAARLARLASVKAATRKHRQALESSIAENQHMRAEHRRQAAVVAEARCARRDATHNDAFEHLVWLHSCSGSLGVMNARRLSHLKHAGAWAALEIARQDVLADTDKHISLSTLDMAGCVSPCFILVFNHQNLLHSWCCSHSHSHCQHNQILHRSWCCSRSYVVVIVSSTLSLSYHSQTTHQQQKTAPLTRSHALLRNQLIRSSLQLSLYVPHKVAA